MTDRIYTATAAELMTAEVDGKTADENAGDVYDWLSEHDYTAAPITTPDSDEPIGYVERDRIEDRSVHIRAYVETFGLSNIISTGANFEEILSALRRRYFYFLGGANDLTGILTRADINKTAAYIHLYERITFLEELLREMLIGWEEDWKEYLDDGAVGSINGRRDDHSGLNLTHVYYANFSHLIKAIYQNNLFKNLGFNSAEESKEHLYEIKNLRDDVAHRKLILESDKIEEESPARDIADLDEIYHIIMRSIRQLEGTSTTSVFTRSPSAVNKIRSVYAGTCQVCGEQELKDEDHPMVEANHILPIQKGGSDSPENIIVLCPNHSQQFRRGELRINPEDYTIEKAPNSDLVGGELIMKGNHSIDLENLKERNEIHT